MEVMQVGSERCCVPQIVAILSLFAPLPTTGTEGAAAAAPQSVNCHFVASGTDDGPATLEVTVSSGKKITVPIPEGCGKMKAEFCRLWKGPGKAKAVHFRASVEKGASLAFEAFVGEVAGNPKLAWAGITGLDGKPGEREGWFLDYEPVEAPLPQGSLTVPILYFLDERVSLCGFGPAPLLVRRYDPASASFRPVTFDRLRRWKRGERTGWGWGAAGGKTPVYEKPLVLQGRFVPAGAVRGTASPSLSSQPQPASTVPSGKWLVFEASSSSQDASRVVKTGLPPSALSDGDPLKGWVEGSGGGGMGEFVTARTVSDQIPLTGMELVLALEGSLPQAKGVGGVKKLAITSDKGKVFFAVITADPRRFPDKKVVIDFPMPLRTSCISVIIEEVWPSDSGAGWGTFIGEITPRSMLDEPKGFSEVLNTLVKTKSYKAIDAILAALTDSGVAIAEAAWDDLSDRAKDYIVAWASAKLLYPPAGASLAAKKVRWVVERKRHGLVFHLLHKLSEVPWHLLKWYESEEVPLELKTAAAMGLFLRGYDKVSLDVLSYFANPSLGEKVLLEGVSMTHFLALGLKIPPVDRTSLLLGGAASGTSSPPLREQEWCALLEERLFGKGGEGSKGGESSSIAGVAGTPGMPTDVSRIMAILFALHDGRRSECSARLGTRLWKEGGGSFETRYYLLQLFKKLVVAAGKCKGCAALLGDGGVIYEALSLDEEPLRATALDVFAGTVPSEKVGTGLLGKIVVLLDDHSPWIRAKAVGALASLGLPAAGTEDESKIVGMATGDFWPEVRKAAVKALTNVEKVPEETLFMLLLDPSPEVRKSAIRLAIEKGLKSKEGGRVLLASALSDEMRWDVREEAALAIGKLCIGGFEKELREIVRAGLYPDSTEAQIAAASGAALSLGMLGDTAATDTLLLAVQPGIRSEVALSAIEALGMIGGGKGTAILEALVGGDDPKTTTAAALSLERLKSGVGAPCKK